ncbi:unnamed protein product [Clavelina lepadiformis]|uniref:Uncharacterized protein n=1 Tax=Clavelina lepadiformis TaxID=159417 RepID=A0ABP0F6Q5_CLALP
MSFKLLVSASIAVIVGYCWLNYVKRGPVYKSDKELNGKTVLITGGNSGIGKALAMDLAKRGARVVIASRNLKKSNKVKDEIVKESGNHGVRAMELDLADFDSVRKFAKDFNESEKYLDYFVNNAGVTMEGMTKYGLNRILVVNYFSRFLFINLLLDKMKKQSAERPVRIVNLISDMYKFTEVIQSEMTRDPKGIWECFYMYAQSDFANIQFTYDLHRKLEDEGITTYNFDPGVVFTGEYHSGISFYDQALFYVPMLFYSRRTSTVATSPCFTFFLMTPWWNKVAVYLRISATKNCTHTPRIKAPGKC